MRSLARSSCSVSLPEKRRTNMLSGIILQPGAWDATIGGSRASWNPGTSTLGN